MTIIQQIKDLLLTLHAIHRYYKRDQPGNAQTQAIRLQYAARRLVLDLDAELLKRQKVHP